MNLLRDYGPFADIPASHVNDVVAHLVIISKICLKPPCPLSKFPIVNATSALHCGQPFAVSFT